MPLKEWSQLVYLNHNKKRLVTPADAVGYCTAHLSITALSMVSSAHQKVDRAGFEPAASALRRRRSYQADLPALSAATESCAFRLIYWF
jgi:hypothetical protein